MSQSKSASSIYAWLMFVSINTIANAASVVPEQNISANSTYGRIHFNNDKGEEKCTIAIPETKSRYNFNAAGAYCENNMVSTFWLENVSSATLIQFFENESCSNSKTPSNFFFLLKTVKQPTDWQPHGGVTHSIDALRNVRPGNLIPGKNLRVEADGAFVGADLSSKNLNERLSCVYIERSQPAN